MNSTATTKPRSGKFVVTGAAGLVGQNLVLLLGEIGYTNIVAIDKHGKNLRLLSQLNPRVRTMEADLAEAGTWTRQAVMIADKTEEEDSFDFEGASGEVETLLPESVTSQRISRGQGNDGAIRAQIIEGINERRLLVNYIGHGSVEIWRGGVFSSDDVPALTNGARLPFFVTMTCLNGYFHDRFPIESLAESLLKAEGGGAIAVWTSSGLTEPNKQAVMNKELIQLLFNGQSFTLGEATAKAKKVVSDQDVRRTWILFGDPTTRLRVGY